MIHERTAELLMRMVKDLEEVNFELPSLGARDVGAHERVNTAQFAARALRGLLQAEKGVQFAILHQGLKR